VKQKALTTEQECTQEGCQDSTTPSHPPTENSLIKKYLEQLIKRATSLFGRHSSHRKQRTCTAFATTETCTSVETFLRIYQTGCIAITTKIKFQSTISSNSNLYQHCAK
jgi:hypothetical protein